MRMHADQVEVSPDAVADLVTAQFPRWRGLPVTPVGSDGTVNALFRLGDQVVLRFPLQPDAGEQQRSALVSERDKARRIAAERQVRLQVPVPLDLGEPGPGYPGLWSAWQWIPGEPASAEHLSHQVTFARDLAGFVQALHRMDTGGRTWDGHSRGGRLSTMDGAVRRSLADSTGLADVPRLTQLWDRCLAAPEHAGPGVELHADLMPGNLLVRDGRLAAVIDLGTPLIGDPAVDLMPAWNLLTGPARQTYRTALATDDATWERGQGWAVAQAIMALPYYLHTNPVMARTARHTLGAVLE